MTTAADHVSGPVLTTERLTLRPPALSDFPGYVQFFGSDVSSMVGGPLDTRGAWKFFSSMAGHWALHGYGWFTVERRDVAEVIGTLGPHYPPQHADMEIGWITYPEAQGNGFGFEAAQAARHLDDRDTQAFTIGKLYRPRQRSIEGVGRETGRCNGRNTCRPCSGLRSVGASMTDTAARAAQVLKQHRASIDRLDAILIYTLGERFKHTQDVGHLKARHDLPPSDPDREAQQIARLESLAREADLDPAFAKKLLTFVIAEVIQHHKKIQGDP